MPRNPSTGEYTLPAGTNAITDQTIDSGRYNAFLADVAGEFNSPRPITAGGTGASNATDAMVALGGELAGQVVDSFDTFAFKSGSFVAPATVGVTAPVNGHAFEGIAYVYDASNAAIEARDINDTVVPGRKYIREMKAGVWSAWVWEGLIASGKVDKAGDTMTGDLAIAKVTPSLILNKPTTGNAQVVGQMAGKSRWAIVPGDATAEGGTATGSNFLIARYNNAGAFLSSPLTIERATGQVGMSELNLNNTVAGRTAVTLHGVGGAAYTFDFNGGGDVFQDSTLHHFRSTAGVDWMQVSAGQALITGGGASGVNQIAFDNNVPVRWQVGVGGSASSQPSNFFIYGATGSVGFVFVIDNFGRLIYNVPNLGGGSPVGTMFAKSRNATNGVHYEWTDVGGLVADASGGAFWRGIQLVAPTITDPVGGGSIGSRFGIYSEYNTLAAPSIRSWCFDMGSDSATSRHTFRLRSSGTDILAADPSIFVSNVPVFSIGPITGIAANSIAIDMPSANNGRLSVHSNATGTLPTVAFASRSSNASVGGDFMKFTPSGTTIANGNLSILCGFSIAQLSVIPPTGISQIVLNPQQAAQQAAIIFQQSGVTKWMLGKQTDDSFFIFKSGATNPALSIDANNVTQLTSSKTGAAATATPSTLFVLGGLLGNTANNEINLGGFAVGSPSVSMLNVHWRRLIAGSDFSTAGVGLSLDVDATIGLAQLWFSPAGTLGIGTSTPDGKSVLDLTSTTKGFLPPRMTTTQRDAITAPPAGLTVYNSTLGGLSVYDGTNWDNLTPDTVLWKNINADATAQNIATVQPWFPTAGAVTVEASTLYQMDGVLMMVRSAGTTVHTVGLSFGGTSVSPTVTYDCIARDPAVSTTVGTTHQTMVASASNTIVTGNSSGVGSETYSIEIHGTMRTSGVAGTIIPQFTLSAIPGGAPSVKAGSYFMLTKLGATGTTSSGTWA